MGTRVPFFDKEPMIVKEKIEEIARAQLVGSELFLVGVSVSAANEIEVTVDGANRVTIDECAILSKSIEKELDRQTEDFELSVFSTGIGQPLKLLKQYQIRVGRLVDLVLKNGLKVLGTLTDVSEEGITVEYLVKESVDGKKRKVDVTKTEHYKFDEIKTTKEEIDFK